MLETAREGRPVDLVAEQQASAGPGPNQGSKEGWKRRGPLVPHTGIQVAGYMASATQSHDPTSWWHSLADTGGRAVSNEAP